MSSTLLSLSGTELAGREFGTDDVWVIRYNGGKYDGVLVGTALVPRDAMPLPLSAWPAEIVRLWVHRAGLAPEAARHYIAEFCPAVLWADLKGASEPIVPAHGGLSRRQIVELVREWQRIERPNVLRTDGEAELAARRCKQIARILYVGDLDEAVEKYGSA